MSAIDLADVIENTRRLKMRLCLGPLKQSPDRVYQGEFIDLTALEDLKAALLDCPEASTEPEERRECIGELQAIIDAVREDPRRPTDRELCTRFVEGRIDARTVIHITTWTPVELYDACSGFDLRVPDIRS